MEKSEIILPHRKVKIKKLKTFNVYNKTRVNMKWPKKREFGDVNEFSFHASEN